ncbi:MAG: ring-opening amidohydrolase [Verrucomicrobia bacterium]|nr:ring-opening amidohydrolase [Verrucomicrobiota bacterium]
MRADVHRFILKEPSDVSGLREAMGKGIVDPGQIVAVIGKTHGNGLVNDYTRGYLTLCLSQLIGGQLGIPAEQVAQRIPFVFSGGVEGVLSPHYAVFTVDPDAAVTGQEMSLAIGVAFTPEFGVSDIGGQRQIDLTAEAVEQAMANARIERPKDVHFVQVKGPAFTRGDMVAAAGAGLSAVTDHPGKLMGFGRAASALGVAKALGEISPGQAVASAVLRDFTAYSSVASASAGLEVRANEVIVAGLSSAWSGPLTIAHRRMQDALDIESVTDLARDLRLEAAPQVPAAQVRRIRAAFVKCEAQRDGTIRGRPHTMLDDGDIDQQRHIRAAVGAIVAAVLNDTALFVSGGAEHQGPDGGGLVAVIADKA